MRALVACLALFVTAAQAGAVYQSRAVTLHLTDKPCTGIPAALLGEEDAKAFRHADLQVRGKPLDACWSLQDDKVLLIDAEGDAGYLPASAFKHDGA